MVKSKHKNRAPSVGKKDKVKIIRSAIVMAFAAAAFILIILSFNSLSWFAFSRSAGVEGFGVRSADIKGYEVEYRAFRYDLYTDKCTEIDSFDVEESNGLLLSEYDMIFSERNKYAGVLLRIDIKGEVEAGRQAVLRLTRNQTGHTNELCISDISKFQCDVEDNCDFDDILDDDDLDDLWSNALSYFDSANAPDELKFSNNSNNIDLMTFTQSADEESVIWLFMNYDDDSVRNVIQGTSLTLTESVSVYNDCDIIKVYPQ
ncbi:hypothetical protein [Ruminococcus albus]|uniref:Uncharacterized protein n=1 Tax=Ruminococcus albus TaxID=1264 RepID=A0A1I1CZX4_RUMAL|nr:hypothetical protein [Ruminococcus albus]SFB68215.1 hypothetical protein SAMN02910406_00229 [Ruminococcus albus]